MKFALLLKFPHNSNFFEQVFAFFLSFLKNSQPSLLVSKTDKSRMSSSYDFDFGCVLKASFETRYVEIIVNESVRMSEVAAIYSSVYAYWLNRTNVPSSTSCSRAHFLFAFDRFSFTRTSRDFEWWTMSVEWIVNIVVSNPTRNLKRVEMKTL